KTFYEGKPFMRVVEHLPATKDVANSNFCDMTLRIVRGQPLILCVLDNLIKGASGVAVQNFNLMNGFAETTALLP
ncbi:MAG: N-acetyl-gamma-glutamyl-phosphate reductase, partial [Planctomycetaceae bacterium]